MHPRSSKDKMNPVCSPESRPCTCSPLYKHACTLQRCPILHITVLLIPMALFTSSHPTPQNHALFPVPNSPAMVLQCHQPSSQLQGLSNAVVGSMQWLVAIDGEDSFSYAHAAVTESAGGEDGDKGKFGGLICLFGISAPTIRSTIPDGFTHPSPTSVHVQLSFSCQCIFKFLKGRTHRSATRFIVPRSVHCGTP